METPKVNPTVSHSCLFLSVVEPQISVFFPHELSDARLPAALLVARHPPVLARSLHETFALPPQGEHELLFPDLVERGELLAVVVHVEVGHGLVAAALDGSPAAETQVTQPTPGSLPSVTRVRFFTLHSRRGAQIMCASVRVCTCLSFR